MNCKPGDLAIIIKSMCGNEGKIVRVLHASAGNNVPMHGRYEECGTKGWVRDLPGFMWVVESEGSPLNVETKTRIRFTMPVRPVMDEHIRPLRDDEEQPSEVLEREREE